MGGKFNGRRIDDPKIPRSPSAQKRYEARKAAGVANKNYYMAPLLKRGETQPREQRPNQPPEQRKTQQTKNNPRNQTSHFEPAKTKTQAENYMRDKLGITNVKTNGIPLESLNAINKALTDAMHETPQLIKTIQRVEVMKKDSGKTVMAFAANFKNGKISTTLQLSANNLSNLNEVHKMIKTNVDKKNWSPKAGIDGVIQHEMAHVLEFKATCDALGVNPFSDNVNDLIKKAMCIKAYKNHLVSKSIIEKAIKNLGEKPTAWQKISNYAAQDYGEAFAEALSDSSDNRLSNEIKRIIKGGVK